MAVRIVLQHLSGSRAARADRFAAAGAFELTAGREPSCELRYADGDDLVSRQHLRITGQGDAFTLTDLGSRNGTFVNRQRVFGPVRLNSGDVVQLGTGGPEFRFLVERDSTLKPARRLAPGQPRRKTAVPVRAILVGLAVGAVAAAAWVYRSHVAEWAGSAWASRLRVARWAASLIPQPAPPPTRSKWALTEVATGRVMFEAYAPNATGAGQAAVEGAGANLPVFVLLPGGRILPVLSATSDPGSLPLSITSLGPAAPDWRSAWRWPKEDLAGWLLVVDSLLSIRQMAPFSARQFPAWKPVEGAFVLDAPLEPRSGKLAGQVKAIGGKRLA